MQRRAIVSWALLGCAFGWGSTGAAQTQSSGTQNAINGINSYPGPGLVKYQNTPDPMNRRIDMFMSDWRESMPRVEHGSLVLRDILTKGDNFSPPERGAVLRFANFLASTDGWLRAHGRSQPGLTDSRRSTTSWEGRERSRPAAIRRSCVRTLPS